MKAILEFTWRGETITKYIDNDVLYNDIKEIGDSFWGEFYIGKMKYQFQIFWNASEIAIFNVGGTEPIHYVNGFSVYFSRNLK